MESTQPMKVLSFTSNCQLAQAEHALKYVDQKGYSAIGIATRAGVVLGSQKLIQYYDMDDSFQSNLYTLGEHIGAAFVGNEADCRILANRARLHTNHFRYSYGYPISALQLTKKIADMNHTSTLKMTKRLYGCTMLVGCYDEMKGPIILKTDATANVWAYNAYGIGKNADKLNNLLQNYYSPQLSLGQCVSLALKSLQAAGEEGMTARNYEIGVIEPEHKSFRVMSQREWRRMLNQGE